MSSEQQFTVNGILFSISKKLYDEHFVMAGVSSQFQDITTLTLDSTDDLLEIKDTIDRLLYFIDVVSYDGHDMMTGDRIRMTIEKTRPGISTDNQNCIKNPKVLIEFLDKYINTPEKIICRMSPTMYNITDVFYEIIRTDPYYAVGHHFANLIEIFGSSLGKLVSPPERCSKYDKFSQLCVSNRSPFSFDLLYPDPMNSDNIVAVKQEIYAMLWYMYKRDISFVVFGDYRDEYVNYCLNLYGLLFEEKWNANKESMPYPTDEYLENKLILCDKFLEENTK